MFDVDWVDFQGVSDEDVASEGNREANDLD